ncbi:MULTISPECIES: hypothetical protein [Brasilonema]|jgi:hypothetical protein|nr:MULTISPECIES: hypothetical protein [Brasilonema]
MSNVQVKLTLLDDRLEDSELQEKTENLLQDIKQEVEVEDAGLVTVENSPEGSKSVSGYLLGVLTAKVNKTKIQSFMRLLGDRLLGKTIEIEVTANGKTLKAKASSQAELIAAIKAAQEFVGE